VSGGASSTHSVITPTSDFLRNGTTTREPDWISAARRSGTLYVKVVRSGTASATLQSFLFIARE